MESEILNNYLSNLSRVNTREVRRENTFPNVEKMFKVQNGKRLPLTEEEKQQQKYIVFYNFLNQHFKLGECFGPIYGIRKEDFYNDSVFERLTDYSDVYFNTLTQKVQSGEKSITANKAYDLSHLKKLHLSFKKELPYEQRNFRRLCQKLAKKYPNMVNRCAEINLLHQQTEEVVAEQTA